MNPGNEPGLVLEDGVMPISIKKTVLLIGCLFNILGQLGLLGQLGSRLINLSPTREALSVISVFFGSALIVFSTSRAKGIALSGLFSISIGLGMFLFFAYNSRVAVGDKGLEWVVWICCSELLILFGSCACVLAAVLSMVRPIAVGNPKITSCAKCGYNLTGLLETHCPGCGNSFDPEPQEGYP